MDSGLVSHFSRFGFHFLHMALLEFGENGIYCPAGDFYIDPWKPVKRALITHAHADHARWGHNAYLAHEGSASVLRLRIGQDMQLQTVPYGKPLTVGGVEVCFFPAGHIPGSAQIRVTRKGESWVASGDYKLEKDGISTPFEPVKCHAFITESTFGLPIYKWQPQQQIFQEVNDWWRKNAAEGRTSVLFGYSLGKAQRLLNGLDTSIGQIFVHGAIWNILQVFGNTVPKPPVTRITRELDKKVFAGGMVVAPPSALGSSWMRKFQPYSTGMASGWMTVRGMKRRRAMDQGFIMSDHADWPGLLQAIKETGAEKIFVTHGYTDIFSRYLREQGYDARAVETLYEGDEVEENLQEDETR